VFSNCYQVKTRSLRSIVICVSVAAGMCLAKRCIADGHIPTLKCHVTILNSRNAYYCSVQHILCLPITVAARS
jgi:hypothetical protein